MLKRRTQLLLLLLLILVGGCGPAQICPAPGPGAPFRSRVPLGAAVGWHIVQSSPGYASFFLSHYSWLTPENELKMQSLEPGPARFDFRDADAFLGWAGSRRKAVHGHVLTWGQQLPHWLSASHASPQAAGYAMASYIRTVLAHFRGRVGEWDVVNEAINPDGSWHRNFWFDRLGPAYVSTAFALARAADPRLRLCYNDQGIEVPGPHANAVLRLVRLLRRQRLLDCVGLEVHTAPPPPQLQTVIGHLRRFASTGADVLISEMDVSLAKANGSTPRTVAEQAQVYSTFARACRAVRRCVRFTTWGFTDASSWLGANAEALPFDARCRPKPAWFAIKSALSG